MDKLNLVHLARRIGINSDQSGVSNFTRSGAQLRRFLLSLLLLYIFAWKFVKPINVGRPADYISFE